MTEEVYLLASHHLPSSPFSSSRPVPSVSQLDYPAQKHQSRQNNRLCVAAPAVGITVYDLLDQTPLSSLVLGASFHPTTSAVSRSIPTSSAESIRVKSVRRTWIGVESEGHGQVWSWTEEERKDGSVEGEAIKVVYPLDAAVASILAPRELPDHLVLLSSTGELSLVSGNDLSITGSLPASTSAAPLFQSAQIYPVGQASSLLPSSLVNQIPSNSQAQLVILSRNFSITESSIQNAAAATSSLVELGKKKSKKSRRPSAVSVLEEAELEAQSRALSDLTTRTELEIVLLDVHVETEDGINVGIVSLGRVQVPGTHAVVSPEGFVSSLGLSGALASYQLSTSGHGNSIAVYSDVFTSSSSDSLPSLVLTPLKTQALSSHTLTLSNTSLLALHSSFVLMASVQPTTIHSSATSALAIQESSPTVVTILIWDVRLGAVISESELTVPAAALPSSTTPLSANLSLQLNSPDTAALAILPSSGSTGRSLIYVIPLTLPSASVLAAVVGKQALTKKYLAGEHTIAARAQRTEPIPHPKASKEKLALLASSQEARSRLLDSFEHLSKPLEKGAGEEVDAAIVQAEQLFESFLNEERARLSEYLAYKAAVEEVKEKERRVAALFEKESLKTSGKKYRQMRSKIEEAISTAGSDVPWYEVTAKRIRLVGDSYRYQYYDERKAAEKLQHEGRMMETAMRTDSSEKSPSRPPVKEPTLPSSFVTAILRLSLPGTLSAEADLFSTTSSSARLYKHPTNIIKYLLERGLVGDGVVTGGVTRFLARAGDWPNLMLALESMPDIPESTTVALLKAVVLHHSTVDAIEIDSVGLPQPPAKLNDFLSSFVESPSTPALLRQALQQQLVASEVIPILEVLDSWLAWWAARGGGGGQVMAQEQKEVRSLGKSNQKRLATDPFVPLTYGPVEVGDAVPPRVEVILPLVQALLDAHFITLLLHRQSHSLLRRLSSHIRKHVALQAELANLLGALSIYSRAKESQKQAAVESKKARKVAATDHSAFSKSMAARISAQEKHAEVLEYSVEKFWL